MTEAPPNPSAADSRPPSALGLRRLVVLAPNWLGDAVMALPALADVRRGDQGVEIAVAARPSVAPLFELAPGVDSVVRLDRSSWRRGSPALADGGFDAALLLPNSFHAAYLAWRAGIRERWGFATDMRGPLLTRPIATPWPTHQTLVYQHLVRALGISSGPSEPRLDAPDAVRRQARALLEGVGWNGRAPLVALAAGAAYGGAKRWPASSFAAVAGRIAAEGGVPLLVGSRDDRASGDEIRAALGDRVEPIDLIGRTTLVQLAGVFAECRAVVSNDSGAMHVAAALGVPVVAVFGPTDEARTRPLGWGPCAIVTARAWCRPCLLRECPVDHRCMRGISPDAVMAHLGGVL
jgi:heptosyltransferase-2